MKNLFQKTGAYLLAETIKFESASFPYKKANVKTNKMVPTKWTYHKERRFPSNYFLLKKNIYFSLRTSCKELIYCTNNLNAHICTFCKRWGLI